jgi:hypothetical protein
VNQALLLEDVARGLRLAREREADDADDVGLVDRLSHRAGRLVRVTLGVELLERHLAALVGLVVLVDRQLDAVVDVDTELGVGARLRTDVAEGQASRTGGLSVSCRKHRILGRVDRRDRGDVDFRPRTRRPARGRLIGAPSQEKSNRRCNGGSYDDFLA